MTEMLRAAAPWASIAVLALVACGQPPDRPRQPAGLTEARLAAIDSMEARYLRAFRAGDWEGVASYFALDGVQMPPGADPVVGREAIRQRLASAPGEIIRFDISPLTTEGADGLAWVRGRYTITTEPPEGSAPVSDTGSYVMVLREQPDGEWRIRADIWNSDRPASP